MRGNVLRTVLFVDDIILFIGSTQRQQLEHCRILGVFAWTANTGILDTKSLANTYITYHEIKIGKKRKVSILGKLSPVIKKIPHELYR